MKTYALFGYPVTHSLSPLMHNAAFVYKGIDARYIALEAHSTVSVIEALRSRRISGASVTIPLKVAVLDAMDEVSESALRIGAVNTILRKGHRLAGDNTDWLGIDQSLRGMMGDLQGKTFLVLGAGGTARAALYAVLRGGGQAIVVNRTKRRARELAEEFSCRAHPIDGIEELRADCFINTTPQGMRAHEDESPLEKELLGRFRWGMDAVYTPLETRLVREAREAGCTAVGGLDMFIRQGAEQFRLWTGREAPHDLMADIVRKRLENEGNRKD